MTSNIQAKKIAILDAKSELKNLYKIQKSALKIFNKPVPEVNLEEADLRGVYDYWYATAWNDALKSYQNIEMNIHMDTREQCYFSFISDEYSKTYIEAMQYAIRHSAIEVKDLFLTVEILSSSLKKPIPNKPSDKSEDYADVYNYWYAVSWNENLIKYVNLKKSEQLVAEKEQKNSSFNEKIDSDTNQKTYQKKK